MHPKKAPRVLVPAALSAALLFGAAAPASALVRDDDAELRQRVAAVQSVREEVEDRAAAAQAGPLDDLLAGLSATLNSLLGSLTGMLGGIKLPPIELPKLPPLELPKLPPIELPVELPKLPPVELPLEPPKLPLEPPAVPLEPPAVPLEPPAAAPVQLPAVPDLKLP
ncbi:hypothetical protein [Streptomyces sp. NPDC086023]|uniref:hypothetical protein n=1 Tax=Streptomyces sp. NPDC086023 TaxID=3365746 RepID=UPI0037D4D4AD